MARLKLNKQIYMDERHKVAQMRYIVRETPNSSSNPTVWKFSVRDIVENETIGRFKDRNSANMFADILRNNYVNGA